MIYVRGQAQDYDAWQAAGAQGWSFGDIEPYFRKLESYAQGGESRGKSGPMHLEPVAERFPIADAFLKAAREDGQHNTHDYNSSEEHRVGKECVSTYSTWWSPYH